MTTRIAVADYAGDFAENKDAARELRENVIAPGLGRGETLKLDFQGVSLATQSFVHALVSDLIRTRGADVLDHLIFTNCNDSVKSLINIVVEYSQDTTEVDARD